MLMQSIGYLSFPRTMTKARWEKVKPIVEGQIHLILDERE
jgi:hypothetical protein